MNKEIKLVKANLEYLKKLFVMPDSPDKFIRLRQGTLQLAAERNGEATAP